MSPVYDFSRRDFLRCGGAGAVLALTGTAFEARAAPTLKVGFALVSPAAEAGWTKQHILGVNAIKQALGDAVEISIVDNVFQPQDAERIFRGFAAAGHKLVYGTSISMAKQYAASGSANAAFTAYSLA